jgi:adenine-specific DNA methylase
MQSLEGPLGFRRHAKMILTKQGDKCYESLNEFDRMLERRVADEYQNIAQSFPIVEIEPGYNTNQMLKHNYRYWHELFSDRQLVCIRYMTDAIKKIKSQDIRLLFACLFSGTLEFNNLFTSFKGEGTGAVRHMFSHHVLRPEMMPLEANLWGTTKSSGAFSRLFHSRVVRALAYKSNPTELRLDSSKSTKVGGINHPIAVDVVDSFSDLLSRPETTYLSVGDSCRIDIPDNSIDLLVTDPPFFDNVHYSQLADFFYYWLNQMLEFSSTTTTRRRSEVQDTDSERFTAKLTSVFTECRRVLRKNSLLVFTYHHSRHEGWTAVHRAIRRSGFVCIQAYPIKAEMSVSMPLQQARSPIHLDLILVCRRDLGHVENEPEYDAIVPALRQAERQVSSLKGAGIKVSLGDAKVVLMGRFLCEAHKMKNLKLEEDFLSQVENEIDQYVGQVISTKGEILYAEAEPQQLVLFEEMRQYLVCRHVPPTANPHG